MTHPFRPIALAALAFALLIAVVLLIGPQGDPTSSIRPAGQTDHSVLQRDAEMTQRMSVDGPPGVMEQGRTTHDDQLVHSSSPGFTSDLEQHQADIDRMLARDDR